MQGIFRGEREVEPGSCVARKAMGRMEKCGRASSRLIFDAGNSISRCRETGPALQGSVWRLLGFEYRDGPVPSRDAGHVTRKTPKRCRCIAQSRGRSLLVIALTERPGGVAPAITDRTMSGARYDALSTRTT